MSFYITSMLAQKWPEAQEGALAMISEVIFKMRSTLKASGSFRYQTQSQVAASAFLSSSQYLLHGLELSSSDLYCNSRTSLIPSLITVLGFILKMSSVYALTSQILFQNTFKDCKPCRSPYKSYDWIS